MKINAQLIREDGAWVLELDLAPWLIEDLRLESSEEVGRALKVRAYGEQPSGSYFAAAAMGRTLQYLFGVIRLQLHDPKAAKAEADDWSVPDEVYEFLDQMGIKYHAVQVTRLAANVEMKDFVGTLYRVDIISLEQSHSEMNRILGRSPRVTELGRNLAPLKDGGHSTSVKVVL